MTMLAVAALIVVALPAAVVRRVGERTGVVRAQDRWAVQVQADAARVAAGRSPFSPPAAQRPIGREAFSTSFRLEPPAELTPNRPLVPPGSTTLVALLRPLGLRDPRPLLLVALAALATVTWRVSAGSLAPAALALALVPPLALGSVLGSPVALPTAALVASFLAARGGRPGAAGFLAGAAAAFDLRAALVAPFLLIGRRESWRRAVAGFLAGHGLLVLPVAALDPGAFLTSALTQGQAEPGVGLANLFFYRGQNPWPVGLALAALLVTASLLLLVQKGRLDSRTAAAAASLAAVFLSSTGSVEALGLPMALLALGGLREADGG